ncbi:MAG TPA: PQQ-like beta-propeller repeat protein [Anaerohalosphaeraceae bacterium]|nr:PQQ-like beta-propeller repeat protein [Anaerohalosphaeraceae bacterium]HQJ68563.1 PQQ-like beta-propeller repeat protein [Anaerohalosphaeraceae bacterium]
MKKLSKSSMFCCVIFFWLGSVSFSADWPQWRGPQRDGKASGFSAPSQWPAELKQKWSVPVGLGVATPALAGRRLYVFTRQGDEEAILCLDADSGKEVWSNRYAAVAVTGAPGRFPGPRSSPAVGEGKVVTLGVGGVLSCLQADDGKLLWRTDPYSGVVPRFFTAMSPLITDAMAIAQLGGQGNGGILAFDLTTGQVKWQWTQEGPEYASPMILTAEGTRQIAALTEKSVVGLALEDGRLLWKLPFLPLERSYNSVTPIVDGPVVVYSGASRGTFAVRIEKQGEQFVPVPLWENKEIATRYNTPVLHQGYLYGLSEKGNLFCLNAADGKLSWLDEVQRDRGGFGAIVDVGSALMALPSNGELIVLEPDEKAFKQKVLWKTAQTPVYAHPVLDGGRIYIKDEQNLTLWTLEEPL